MHLTATDWHDGQFAHAAHARIARRAKSVECHATWKSTVGLLFPKERPMMLEGRRWRIALR
jgi:hypothetical protein